MEALVMWHATSIISTRSGLNIEIVVISAEYMCVCMYFICVFGFILTHLG